ncbi:TolC family protein [Nitrosophilus labii]|uniref:TolC family protein n=1 Tax=Nitrosophilus labii TaxID=2706014 RepID=UPI001656BD03|nr:TolC family protein [Nitrosophilus labii]
MKRYIFILLPLFLSADSFEEILNKIENNYLLKSKNYEIEAKREIYESQKGKYLPKVDASLKALYLQEEPKLYVDLKVPGLPEYFQAASINQYIGEISLTYPIFTGFAIENVVEKSRLDMQKSVLEKNDLKRNLYIKSAKIYSLIYSLNYAIKATKEALKAIELAYKKAKGFYEQGLIPPSEIYNIEAKKYEIESILSEYRSKKESMLYILGYLTNDKIEDVEGLRDIKLDRVAIKKAIESREDVLAIKKALMTDEKDIALAKSNFYPKLFFKGALRKYGSNLELNGDGYKNANESYVAFEISQNIFNGLSDKKSLEAAKYKKMARIAYLRDYKSKIESSLKSDFKVLDSLKTNLISAKKRVKAAKSYYKLIEGRFQNQLSSADELSRAIADLAKAKAEVARVKSAIFNQKCKILLEGSLETFKKSFGK